ncbi:MAG TPA: cytochrome c1 [Steroidobacteraceae bacterium]|nr:cytochrome c1 [Steroidobacteraceae bacterium]
MRTRNLIVRGSAWGAALALAIAAAWVPGRAPLAQESGHGYGSDWESWKAGNSVADLASLQRGARDFLNYCNGCHSLQFMRYSRVGQDLKIPPKLLAEYLVPSTRKPADYITSPMPAADAESWFGKQPPDLSLIAQDRGVDYLYQYLTTFYVDPSRATGANNLALATTAMPDVLSELEGLKRAVFRNEQVAGATQPVFDHFETIVPGSLTREQYASFVRDIVNFLDYVGEPNQDHRRALGVWVVLFLLVFTWLTWLLKKEYWKDVH